MDKKLLDGWQIEFFTSKDSHTPGTDYYVSAKEIQEIARKRNIAINLHDDSMKYTSMLEALCRAKGAIHYALADANPRAVYEEVLAGLPVLVSHQSRVAHVLKRQPFVKLTDATNPPSKLNEDLAWFLDLIGSREKLQLDAAIDTFIDEEMELGRALHNMCETMLICSHRDAASQSNDTQMRN